MSEEEARLFVATPDFWSKYAAKEAPRVVSKLLRDLGVVFIDEADQLVVGGLMAVTFGAQQTMVTFDPGQNLWPVGVQDNFWAHGQCQEMSLTPWFSGPTLHLTTTRHFGPQIVGLLQACLPFAYSSLVSAPDAPATIAFAYWLDCNDCGDATRSAGTSVAKKETSVYCYIDVAYGFECPPI